MTKSLATTRRAVLAGGAALATLPVFAALPTMALSGSATATETAKLWAQAEAVRAQLHPFAETIAAAHARTGLPGWMHVAGKANELGNRRYHLLVRVLGSQPKSQDDLALIAQTVNDTDMQNGPKSWAHAQFDRAANGYHAG